MTDTVLLGAVFGAVFGVVFELCRPWAMRGRR